MKGEIRKPCYRGAGFFRALLPAPQVAVGAREVTPQPDENLGPRQRLALSLSSLSDWLLRSRGLQGGGKVIKCFA